MDEALEICCDVQGGSLERRALSFGDALQVSEARCRCSNVDLWK